MLLLGFSSIQDFLFFFGGEEKLGIQPEKSYGFDKEIN